MQLLFTPHHFRGEGCDGDSSCEQQSAGRLGHSGAHAAGAAVVSRVGVGVALGAVGHVLASRRCRANFIDGASDWYKDCTHRAALGCGEQREEETESERYRCELLQHVSQLPPCCLLDVDPAMSANYVAEWPLRLVAVGSREAASGV